MWGWWTRLLLLLLTAGGAATTCLMIQVTWCILFYPSPPTQDPNIANLHICHFFSSRSAFTPLPPVSSTLCFLSLALQQSPWNCAYIRAEIRFWFLVSAALFFYSFPPYSECSLSFQPFISLLNLAACFISFFKMSSSHR